MSFSRKHLKKAVSVFDNIPELIRKESLCNEHLIVYVVVLNSLHISIFDCIHVHFNSGIILNGSITLENIFQMANDEQKKELIWLAHLFEKGKY